MTVSWLAKNIAGFLALSVACTTTPCIGAVKPAPLTERESAEHVLDQLTFGPRPGDVAEVEKMGGKRWIELQLHPEKIDNSTLNARLAMLPAMQLSTEELIRKYPPNPVIRQLDAGRIAMPNDPVERAIYSNELANYRMQREKKAEGGKAGDDMAPPPLDAIDTPKPSPSTDIPALLREPVAQRWNTLLYMEPGTVRPLLQRMTPVQRQQLADGMTPQQKEVVLALAQVNRVVAGELQEEKLLRAIYSNRQLEEVMTDFWFNHFNIYLRKNGEEPWYLASYERDVIRPHAMGKFEYLLKAVAHSPAMLVYLDNQQSIGPHSLAAMRAATNPKAKNAASGLNENYARELMELHTLGVNGGYTQKDVTEVAKVLTGWGVDSKPNGGYTFEFNERRHEPGPKTVLGHTIRENGEAEGEEVLHMLATSPATAHFLSTQLAMQFVSDNPPKSLVDHMTKSFLKSHGDIRQVLRTMFFSPEFASQDAYRAKLKTPFEFMVSSLRATDADVENATALTNSLNQLGMPLYGVQQPNGYSLKADPWLGTEALLARMNFALALTSNRIPGVKVDIPNSQPDASQNEAQLETLLLDGRVSSLTHTTVMKQMDLIQGGQMPVPAMAQNRPGNRGDLFVPVASHNNTMNASDLAAALLLGSPDFQRR